MVFYFILVGDWDPSRMFERETKSNVILEFVLLVRIDLKFQKSDKLKSRQFQTEVWSILE